MKRLLACLLAALVVAGLGAPVAAAASRPAKVVIIVGPVGPGMTDRFRAQGDEAARIARQYTPDVTKIYSPDATWPRVRKALQGASVVVYMGHGNGWPSRYRDSLFPPTQNGFGLNPVAGGGDSKHQYFGEGLVGSQVTLARNAVVLLHHLCYASGNTEPGLPEGTFAQARQRVDNYAAGFIRAGAAAVSADAWSSPAYMVRSVLQGKRSIDRIWKTAPTANGNFLGFESARSAGYVAQMDPNRASSGFHRSIVLKKGLASKDVLDHGVGTASVRPSEPEAVAEPTLIGTGIKVEAPTVRGLTSAGVKSNIRIPFAVDDRKKLPDKVQASVRWDPIEVSLVPPDPATETTPAEVAPEVITEEPLASPAAEATASPEPSASATPDSSTPPATEPDPSATPIAIPISGPTTNGRRALDNPLEIDPKPVVEQPQPPAETEPLLPAAPPEGFALVQPEQLGDVVQPKKGKIQKTGLLFPVRLPKAPGLYRLTVTLHDGDGVAYDAATQALLSPMLVRVVGAYDARVLAAAATSLEAGTNVPLPLRVVNLGTAPWGSPATVDHSRAGGTGPATAARVVGHWVALDPSLSITLAPVEGALRSGVKPRETVEGSLDLTVPIWAGEYLLVLDVVTPEHGSLASMGVEPTIVRVTVVDAS